MLRLLAWGPTMLVRDATRCLLRQVGSQLSQRQVLAVADLLQLTQLAVERCHLLRCARVSTALPAARRVGNKLCLKRQWKEHWRYRVPGK